MMKSTPCLAKQDLTYKYFRWTSTKKTQNILCFQIVNLKNVLFHFVLSHCEVPLVEKRFTHCFRFDEDDVLDEGDNM